MHCMVDDFAQLLVHVYRKSNLFPLKNAPIKHRYLFFLLSLFVSGYRGERTT